MDATDLWAILPISAIVSAVVTLSVRYFDKPRPNLHLIARGYGIPIDSPWTHEDLGGRFTLTNLGSGVALDVRVVGSGCVVATRVAGLNVAGHESVEWTDRVDALKPGESETFEVHRIDDTVKPAAILATYPALPGIHWLRGLRRTRRWPLDTTNTQVHLPPKMLDPVRVPFLRRVSGDISRYGITARFNGLQKSPFEREDDSGAPPSSQ